MTTSTDPQVMLADLNTRVSELTEQLGYLKVNLDFYEKSFYSVKHDLHETRAAYFRALAALWMVTQNRAASGSEVSSPAAVPPGRVGRRGYTETPGPAFHTEESS